MRQLNTAFIFALTLVFSGSAVAEMIEIELGQKSYRLELALTPAQRRQGLMFRQRLEPTAGMLLVYRKTGDHRIWMKNMKIPLRVFWISEQHEVISAQRLPPCLEEPCPVYSADKPSRYVLELSDDYHALEPGDRIEGLNRL